jgi:excisionase family DNA binding protein
MNLADKIEAINHSLTADDVARLLSISRATVYRKAKAHEIPSFRTGTSVRFAPNILAEWLRRNSTNTQSTVAKVIQ